MSSSAPGLLVLGFGLGLRHALDVDHLAAVATIASQRRDLRGFSTIGAMWGLGHTAALLAVSIPLVWLGTAIPASFAQLFEYGVAAMLVGLGAGPLWQLARGATLHHHAHAHGGRVHSHPHLHSDHHHGAPGLEARPAAVAASGHHRLGRAACALLGRGRRRPFLVGMAHGLAGSAGLMLAALAAVPSPQLALAYVAVFGVGSIVGMTATSAVVGLPLGFVACRFEPAQRAVRGLVAAGSVAVGLAIAFGL